MSDQPIAAEAIRVAAKAIDAVYDANRGEGATHEELAEAAIRAADLSRGLTVEYDPARKRPPEEGGEGWPALQRLVGPWVPVGGEA